VATQLSRRSNGQAVALVTWDRSTRDGQIQFDFGLKNVMTSSLTERALSLKVSTLHRTVGFAVGYQVTSDGLSSHGELHWDSDTQPDLVYDFDTRQTSVQGQLLYNGTLSVTSYLFNTNSTFSHRAIGDRHFVTEVILDLSEKLTVRSDLNLAAAAGITHDISIQHPRLSRVCMIFHCH